MGGSSGTQYVESQTETSNLPEYARPYFENLLNHAEGVTLGSEYTPYGGQRIADFNPAQIQTQSDIMGMGTPGAFGSATDLAYASGLGALSAAGNYQPGNISAQQIGQPNLRNLNMQAANDVASMNYTPGQVGVQQINQPKLNDYSMQLPNSVASMTYLPGQFDVQQINQPKLNDYYMNQPDNVEGGVIGAGKVNAMSINAPGSINEMQIGEAQTGFGENLNLERYQMDAPDIWGQPKADYYMSPYMQNVIDVSKREAIRDAEKATLADNLGAARQGTYGGSRNLLANLERERNLGQNLSDIQTRGLQSAYENAEMQFERDRGAQMTAGGKNLDANLQIQGLGVGTGLQAALANLDSATRTRISNQAANLQAQGMTAENALRTAMSNQATNLQGQQSNQEADLRASLANQATNIQAQLANQGQQYQTGYANLQSSLGTQQLQTDAGLKAMLANQSTALQGNIANQDAGLKAGLANQATDLQSQLANQDTEYKTGLANLQSRLGVQELGTNTGMQAMLANQSTALQGNLANQEAGLRAGLANQASDLQSQLANQDNQYKTGLANLQAGLGVQELGTTAGLQAMIANQNSFMDAQKLQEAANQFGASYGLDALQQANQSGQTLSNIGQAQQNADISRLGLQGQVGSQYQNLEQQYLDQQYADFLRQRDYPIEMMQYYNSVLRGLPVTPNTTTTTYAPPPSMGAQVLGTGLGAISAANMLG